jgi:hypothetical protein
MPAADESALALAGQLRSLTDDDLAELLGAREVRATGIRDFFDLADALLDADSIEHALCRLDRATLATLAVLSELGPTPVADAPARLHERGLDAPGLDARLARAHSLALITDLGGVLAVPRSVTAHLLDWPARGLPGVSALVSEPAPAALAPVSSTETRFTDTIAAENAFATTTSIAELIDALARESGRELARGGLALPDSKRLASAMGVDLDRVPALLEIASRAGLVALDSGRWLPTEQSATWLLDHSVQRWATLASAWLDRLPIDIRAVLAERVHATWGTHLSDFVDWLFPAGGEWMHERVSVYTRDAELLGITAHQVPSSAGTALLTSGPEAGGRAMATSFPPEVDKVYLQHDLSVVSPGPLEPRLDARLRGMAEVEGRALASTYRFSAASLFRAMACGESERTIREFLTSIALTGIPQPLDYLITEAAQRYGLVRVGEGDDGRALVRSVDSTLLRTLVVDHALAPLGLSRAGDGLISRFDRETVFWALSDARYPAAAEDAAGRIMILERRHATRAAAPVATDSARELIARLRVGSSPDPEVTGQAWLSRQLDAAVKSKLGLTVTVQMPDGTHVDYQLEPASVASGRLRARDRKSDIERTLPLSSIVAVGPPSSTP